MKKTLFLFFIAIKLIFPQTIEQRLEIINNDAIVGGDFSIAVLVKGTSLPAANTLGSATIDIQFDNTKLHFNSSANWAFGLANGYDAFANEIVSPVAVRVGVTGIGVDGTPPGFDIGSTYTTWVELDFTIISSLDAVNLEVFSTTNQIGLFENHANNPTNGVINNYPLTAPENINDAPLPVELSGFSSKIKMDEVTLNWRTHTENNNYGFEVERKTEKSDWEKISFIAGAGNSSRSLDYSYIDKQLQNSKYYYRLKQIDLSGEFNYSNEIEADVNYSPSEYVLFQNYPNPFNPQSTIKFELPEDGMVRMVLYNNIGEKVKELLNNFYPKGLHSYEIDGSTLSSGVYLYVIEFGSGRFLSKKMILLK